MKDLDHLADTGSRSAEKVTPASEDAERVHSVKFERFMSFSPQVTQIINGREPCLRDMIHRYYDAHIQDPERVNELTKRYIEKLWQANLI